MNRREYEVKEPERKYKIEILCFVFWGGKNNMAEDRLFSSVKEC